MFKINVRKEKDALNHMLNINENVIYMDGMICSVHPQLYAFGCIRSRKISVNSDSPIVNDCSQMRDLLKSKKIESMSISPEKGEIVITEPYRFVPKIKIIDDESLVSEAMKRVDVIEGIKELVPGCVFEDPKTHDDRSVAVFKIENALLDDMLGRIGESERLEITVHGGEMKLTNHSNGSEMACDVDCNDSASILLTDDSLKMLKSSLLQREDDAEEEPTEKEKSRAYVVDGCFMVIVNKASTILICMVE